MLIVLTAVAIPCGGDNRNNNDCSSEPENAEENLKENSGENISPQLKDSADRFEVDTVRSATSAEKKKQNDVEENN